MEPTIARQTSHLAPNSSCTKSPTPMDVDTQSALGETTETTFNGKSVSEMAVPFSRQTLDKSPQCLLCRQAICLKNRDISSPEITYCNNLHSHHVSCIKDYYSRNPDQEAPRKNPDLKCFECHNPMPLSMPRWDGEAFICPIRKSELDAPTPYVGAPMTFSLADFPMIDAKEVTVALGFLGAPVIRLLDTSQRPHAEDPARGDYVFCLSDEILITPRDRIDEKKTTVRKTITDYLTLAVHTMSGGSDDLLRDYLQLIHESFSKFDAYENTRPIHMVINDSNNKKLLTFASNYPIYPLQWCKPATQRMVCLENKEGASGPRPTLSSDSAQFESGKRALIDGPDTELPPQKRANTEPSAVSEKRTGQPENTTPQFDRLSFELSVTAPDSKDSLAFFNDMNFSDSRSIRSVFDNDRSPSNDLLLSPQYGKFKTDFKTALSKIREDEVLLVRVKLKKPSDSTKNQDTGLSPAETILDEDMQRLLREILQPLDIIGKFSNTDPKSE
ncbi:hypothetical protein [Endozoicomonas sp. ONNA2]|uniref:hypothetical protein n=1 Tax=Endozoicomonas sp. ONNA2 TaxID=2828741 RepID=UPI0021495F08|nr:hypothetical protein [Endozoicomonas sp. ONNA2]